MGKADRIYQALTSLPWLITEDYLRLMIEIALRQNLDPATVETQTGRRLDNTRLVTERGGVAIIPIVGPIARYMNLFSDISGGTSIQVLARDFTSALNNPDVKAILLQIDSPGGEANGINEFANIVYQARGTKPILAYVGGAGASAAYWIASAADEIVADDTALLGSIGVIAAVPQPDSEELIFVSSQSPRKHPDPTTDEGKADIQSVLDAMADVFVDTVARNRDETRETVLSDFGQGGLFVGQAAVDAGLADRLGSFEAVLAELSAGYKPTRNKPMRKPGKKTAALDSFFLQAQTAPGRVRVDTATTQSPTKEQRPMDEDIVQTPPQSPSQAPPPDDPVLEAQQREYKDLLLAQMRQQQEAMLAQAREQAKLEFERWKAQAQAEQAIQTYAQHVTTPTLQRPHALPFAADEVVAFLASLPPEPRKSAQGMFDRLLASGFVDFSEYGSEADGEMSRDPEERFNELVDARVKTGMARSAAITAVMTSSEGKALYQEMNGASRNGKRGGR